MRAGVVLIEQGKVALIRRDRDGDSYYLFPGGGVEAGETDEETAVREAKEELGLDVEIVRLLVEVFYSGTIQSYYLVESRGGLFGSGDGEEMQGDQGTHGRYTPVWLPVRGLTKRAVYPAELASLIERSAGSWPVEVLRLVDSGHRRQSLSA